MSLFLSAREGGNMIEQVIANDLKVNVNQVKSVLHLLDEGNTVPFIARYRKEMTGNLDEEQIRVIFETHQYQVNLLKRKLDVIRLIEQQAKMTEELRTQIMDCVKLVEVEDLYRPYQQKRKTRATDAIALGLLPLAQWILGLPQRGDLKLEANKYITDDLSVQQAIQGALDIIAEMVSDDVKIRNKIRDSINNYGKIITKVKKKHDDSEQLYRNYYDFSMKVSSLVSHQIMAINRAEAEKVITVELSCNVEYLVQYAYNLITKKRSSIVAEEISAAVVDGLKRLAIPSLVREVRNDLTQRATEQSINVFSLNVERLLSQPPLADKLILGIDPAFRTGCKWAIISKTGELIKLGVIYPHAPVNKEQEALQILNELISQYPIDIVAIGNGTASRETEAFVAKWLRQQTTSISYAIVNEAGASVYSASELAIKEFPNLKVEERSAVSIARRLLDPLAELIKIDPQSLGVGQYQHDLPNSRLVQRLDFAIEKTVNRVGVDLNLASEQLLSHIAGFNNKIAKEVIIHRNKIGEFISRQQLLEVKGLGAKSYSQAAGFLRIKNAKNILDQTYIHPESYDLAYAIMKLLNIKDLGSQETQIITSEADIDMLVKHFNSDHYLVSDILNALAAPLKDYRDAYHGPMLRKDILTLDDLNVGLELEGVVRNVVDFGVFVDIGLKNDGLVHISKLTKGPVGHPSEVVSVGDIVQVQVLNVDQVRHKVQLSMIGV
jgi:protein Tex